MALWLVGILMAMYLALSLLAKYNKSVGLFLEDIRAYYEHIPH